MALAPENSAYKMTEKKIEKISKDEGIANLLDGMSQISINPEYRRQVFVESHFDADIYQSIYLTIKNRSAKMDQKIFLNFVSAEPKVPEQQLKNLGNRYFGKFFKKTDSAKAPPNNSMKNSYFQQ